MRQRGVRAAFRCHLALLCRSRRCDHTALPAWRQGWHSVACGMPWWLSPCQCGSAAQLAQRGRPGGIGAAFPLVAPLACRVHACVLTTRGRYGSILVCLTCTRQFASAPRSRGNVAARKGVRWRQLHTGDRPHIRQRAGSAAGMPRVATANDHTGEQLHSVAAAVELSTARTVDRLTCPIPSAGAGTGKG
jgi:hypothetical protein